jgi:hypothetical protein
MCKYKVIKDAVDWLGEHNAQLDASRRAACRSVAR